MLISGITVMIAMAGMFFSGDKTFMSFAIGTMIVVAVAMIGSLTVLPAVLSKLGDRVEKGRIPFLHRLRRNDDGESRIWGAILDPVLRHPVVSAIALGARCSLALAVPALQPAHGAAGLDALPNSRRNVQAFDARAGRLPGRRRAGRRRDQGRRRHARRVQARDRRPEDARRSRPARCTTPIEVDTSADGTVARVEIPLVGDGTDDGLERTRSRRCATRSCPRTIGKRRRRRVRRHRRHGGVAGLQRQDEVGARRSCSASSSLFAFLLLLVSFRSIVIAVKAIVLNLLSVAAAYGVLVLVFQWGWGEGLLDFKSNGGIASWLPMFMFVILFGLSMDYHVFILSRIREAYDRGIETDGRGRARHQDHGRRRHERRGRDGRRVRDLRDAADPRHEGDGHRPRRRRPDRRHASSAPCCCRRR